MGFGTPYHKHSIIWVLEPGLHTQSKCLHCKLPVSGSPAMRCRSCEVYIHRDCCYLPQFIRHPLHKEHPLTLLTLFASTSITNLCCNKCQEPCLDGYTYHCPICQFTLHLRCFFVLDHEKHHHSLIFGSSGSGSLNYGSRHCRICGYEVENLRFACKECRFVIHHECSLIPPMIKHHHVHELTIRHNFPEECEQVYCDRCEDTNGELDRRSSHYYCQRCDYIAHVPCITQPKEDTVLETRFTHEHPLRPVEKDKLRCNQCDYSVGAGDIEILSFIKHPRHPEHTLAYVGDGCKCKDCEFTLKYIDTFWFVHPYFGVRKFMFKTTSSLFICDVCGELGKGSRMNRDDGIHIRGETDIHLECFALPGKIEHESHPDHPLYLSSIPEEDSACQYCSICNKEIDKRLWMYCCLECDFVAHLTCVANDLLSTLRSSIKNQHDFCVILEPDKTSFELHIAQIGPNTSTNWPPKPLLRNISKIDDDEETTTFKDVVVEEVDGKVCCPRCNLHMSIRAKDS